MLGCNWLMFCLIIDEQELDFDLGNRSLRRSGLVT